jgi:Sel1 repeat
MQMLKLFALVLFACTLLAPRSAAANIADLDLDEIMTLAWEGQWAQTGTPRPVRKWSTSVRVKLVATEPQKWQNFLQKQFDVLQQVSGVRFAFVEPGDTSHNLEVLILSDSASLPDSAPCTSRTTADARGFRSALVRAKASVAHRCLAHELGHVMGIEGHPIGRTVMTYFARDDDFSEYDKFLLKVRYSDQVAHGMPPMLFVEFAANAYVAALKDDPDKLSARATAKKFLAQIFLQMQAYAKGEGDPPRAIFRSGRSVPDAVSAGRATMAYFLGLSYGLGYATAVDQDKSKEFLLLAATKASLPSQVLLAQFYEHGRLGEKDASLAHAWYSCAARNGSPSLRAKALELERALTPEQAALMQAQTLAFFESGRCKLT